MEKDTKYFSDSELFNDFEEESLYDYLHPAIWLQVQMTTKTYPSLSLGMTPLHSQTIYIMKPYSI